jgi:hypothetical protein
MVRGWGFAPRNYTTVESYLVLQREPVCMARYGPFDTDLYMSSGYKMLTFDSPSSHAVSTLLINHPERRLLDHIMSKCSKNLVVKVLWTTSLVIPLESSSTWRDGADGYFGRGYEHLFSQLDDPLSFEECFESWGYDDRVKPITRVHWMREWPDEINWKREKIARYLDSENQMFKMDPISMKLIWSDDKTVVQMTDGRLALTCRSG